MSPHEQVVEWISRGGRATSQQIARELDMNPSTAYHALLRLEAAGLARVVDRYRVTRSDGLLGAFVNVWEKADPGDLDPMSVVQAALASQPPLAVAWASVVRSAACEAVAV